MVSEFGNWGLPTLKDLLTDYGEEPSWFKTGSEETQPHGVQRRFNRFPIVAQPKPKAPRKAKAR